MVILRHVIQMQHFTVNVLLFLIPVKVSTSGAAFQGLFLQARREDGGGVVGTWDTPASNTNTKTMQCTVNKDTITHANTNAKTTVTFSWNPPNSDVGSIRYTYVISSERIDVSTYC